MQIFLSSSTVTHLKKKKKAQIAKGKLCTEQGAQPDAL